MNKTCEICESVVEELVETDLGMMCRTCLDTHFNCDCCGAFVSCVERGCFEDNSYCESCYDNLVGYCEDCEETCRREDLSPEGYCCECRDTSCENGIYHWDYQPCYKFRGKGPLYFGIELEIEFCGRPPDVLIAAADNPYFFLKHDGSIYNGAEVVSHPASFKWINDNFKDTWENVLDVRKTGMKSFKTDTCGIHIHMSKKAFSKFHLYKFLRFFRENTVFVAEISQRNSDNLDQWSTLNSNESIFYQAKRGNTEERYVAVNLKPPKSVEIRIFRGNLLETAFRKNLEFCKALFDFTEMSSCLSLTAIHFHKFVVKNKKQFPNLLAFLLKLEIIKMKRIPTVNGIHREFPSEKDHDNNWTIDSENDSKEWNRDGVSGAVEVEVIPQEQPSTSEPTEVGDRISGLHSAFHVIPQDGRGRLSITAIDELVSFAGEELNLD